MSEEKKSPRRKRGARGQLRRFTNVESVMVEETFTLGLPKTAPESFKSEISDTAGGCYVSATVHNKRYYGVLIEQSALKAASLLHFHDEAASLDLNRRMKLLKEKSEENQDESGQDGDKKQPAVDSNGGPEVGQDSQNEKSVQEVVTQERNSDEGAQAPSVQDVIAHEGVAAPSVHNGDNGEMYQVESVHGQGMQQDSQDDKGSQVSDAVVKEGNGERKRSFDSPIEEKPTPKRAKVVASASAVAALPRAVQKFRYVAAQPQARNDIDQGYRVLVATYDCVDSASEDNADKAQRIQQACQSGGGFVGNYYYQYEVLGSALETSKLKKPTDIGLRTSLGLNSFLAQTPLPTWFPLSNLQVSQHKVLSMLQMKKDSTGLAVWDGKAISDLEGAGTHIPMEPRQRYRVGIIGAGIAGLACARQILLQGELENIDLEVVLLEGRSRVGGRLLTDESTFKCDDGTTLPVELGASWIHGIDHNPLAALAKEAGLTFVTASEEVKMLTENMGNVDETIDEQIGDLFDDLLDRAADDCWDREDFSLDDPSRHQTAVRWYASALRPGSQGDKNARAPETDAPVHRYDSDVSIDHAIGSIIAKDKQKKFSKLSKMEQHLLLWNTKNIEYALGANISDLSMKFWDSDDRHAFEGDHVLLKEGYSQVVRHMMNSLTPRGDRFQLVKDFAVGKVEYALRSTTMPYPVKDNRRRKMLELSDTCCVTSRDGNQSFKFDFVVSTLPLGVLKSSLESEAPVENRVVFQPPLPFTKCDSIRNVGFGLLNKVYLQFPTAFWRLASVLPDGQILFGNASGVNVEQYMFYDVGKSLRTEEHPPAVLMTLISGQEAMHYEQLSDDAVVNKVLTTLRTLFSEETVPEPIDSKITRWGGDEFSRGCYTFLPPGTSDNDFQTLQTPINGNGDSVVLEGSETMRLFWAGEHTTSLHPSMAHGAMLSGIRAAKEVLSAMQFRNMGASTSIDKLIPLTVFRKKNPDLKLLQCAMCHLPGSRAREGSLLAFQKGARQVLVHNNCAENSPEVGVTDGRWKNVIKAVNRGKQIKCTLCQIVGATVGCAHPNCFRSYHFACGEDTGWRFERDGKVFFCDLHRTQSNHGSDCDRLSIQYFLSKNPHVPLRCVLCGVVGDSDRAGKILALQQRQRQVLVHEKCIEHCTIVETVLEDEETGTHYRNLLEALEHSKYKFCAKCNSAGATIACSEGGCIEHVHFACAIDTGWDFGNKKGKQFCCETHRNGGAKKAMPVDHVTAPNGGIFQHNLFCGGSDTLLNGVQEEKSESLPSNAKIGSTAKEQENGTSNQDAPIDVDIESSDESNSSDEESEYDVLEEPLSEEALPSEGWSEVQVTLQRKSEEDPWRIAFNVADGESVDKKVLCVVANDNDELLDGLQDGDIVCAIGDGRIGALGRSNLREILVLLKCSTTVDISVLRTTASNEKGHVAIDPTNILGESFYTMQSQLGAQT